MSGRVSSFSRGGGTTTVVGEITRELVNSSDGQGLHFNGAGNIDIASPPDLGTKFSFEFIIQADSWPASGTYIYIVDFGNGGRFVLGNPNTGNFSVRSVTGDWISFGSPVLDDLKVHHIVVTVDGTSAITYDNGNLVGTATINSPNIDSCADARIGSDYVGTASFFNGTIYRARLWNKTLSSAEVTDAYENATVPFADQYGSQTTINSGTTTSGLRYRITARDGVDFTTVGAADNNVGTEFIATGAVTLDANDTVVRIGCAVDLDLSFANPTQSDQVQDRSTNNVKGTASSGVTQVTPIEQLNAKAARIGTSAATPADGELFVSGSARIGTSEDKTTKFGGSASGLTVGGAVPAVAIWDTDNANHVTYVAQNSGNAYLGTATASPIYFQPNGVTKMTIESSGNIIVASMPTSSAGLATGTLWNDSGTVKIA